jgi:CRISPR-associated protein Csx10
VVQHLQSRHGISEGSLLSSPPPAKDANLPDNRFEAEIKTRLQTRTGIDRRRNIVEEGILYNREVIVEGSHFWGTVKLIEDENLLNDFKSFLDDVNDAELLSIGTGRTRGLGKINLDYHDQDPQDTPDRQKADFCQRLETFHEAVCRVAGSKNAFYFAVTLHSPLLQHDGWLRARTTLNEEDIADLTGLPKESFRQWYQAAGVRRITGWSDIWGTPRTQDYALDTGSVFLFSSSHQPKEELIYRLFALEKKGAGLRLSEGFGRLCISDTFHTEGEHV